jgi:hypothetical protein
MKFAEFPERHSVLQLAQIYTDIGKNFEAG